MSIYLTIGFILFFYVITCFIISLILKRNDIADIAWGIGFILIGWSTFILSNYSTISLLVNILVSIWGIRY